MRTFHGKNRDIHLAKRTWAHFSFDGLAESVDLFDYQKHNERHQDKIYRSAYERSDFDCRIPRQPDSPFRKVDPSGNQAYNGIKYVIYYRIHDRGKSRADNHANRQVNCISFDGELFEFFKHKILHLDRRERSRC